jgi:hypothetical protein
MVVLLESGSGAIPELSDEADMHFLHYPDKIDSLA